MKAIVFSLLACILLTSTVSLANIDIRQTPIQFDKGKTEATISGEIKGYEIADYQLRAQAGQLMAVDFNSSNLAAYFNVLPPDSEVALFVGSINGSHYEGRLPQNGVYTVRVYMMRSAARRKETASYSFHVGIVNDNRSDVPVSTPSTDSSSAFDRTVELQGVRFQVKSDNSGSINTLRIIPSGLEVDNAPIERSIEGTITGADIADLNVDGSPEIYVYANSAGSGSYGTLIAYSANNLKSLSEIYLPPVSEDPKNSKGYMGHDQFAVVENVLVQRFPVYRDGDTNAKPTGGTRQLQYKLIPGEAGWLLKLDKVVEY